MIIRVLNFERIRKEFSTMPGFVRLPVDAIRDSRLARSSIIVLAVIIDRSDKGTWEASATEIAEKARVSIASAKRAVKELEEYDYITIIRSSGGKNKYIQNEILPHKKRKKAEEQENDKVDIDTALKLWEEAGVLERIRKEGI